MVENIFDQGEFQGENHNYVNENETSQNENNQKQNINLYQIERRKRKNKTVRTITGYYYSSKSLNNTQSYIVNKLNDIKLDEAEDQIQKVEKKKKEKNTQKSLFFKNKKRK